MISWQKRLARLFILGMLFPLWAPILFMIWLAEDEASFGEMIVEYFEKGVE